MKNDKAPIRGVLKFTAHGICLDLSTMSLYNVSKPGKPILIDLSLQQLRTLSILMRNSGQCFSREQLRYGVLSNAGSESRNIDLIIKRIREKIPHPEAIQTIHNVGYCFVPTDNDPVD